MPCRLLSPASRCAAIALTLLALASPLRSQQTAPFVYAYDDAGRLVGLADAMGNTVTYTYDALGNIASIARGSAAVSILSFNPRTGPVGTSVTIVGAGFSAAATQNAVTFNGAPAAVVTATANRLTVVVPAGATTGPIRVTAPAGSALSATPFTVGSNGAPSISGFAPTVGTAGDAVTIIGANFEPVLSSNKLLFNGSLAVINSATATALGTVVPPFATSGPIAVTTSNGRAISAGDFFIPPSPYTAADVEVTSRIAIGETRGVTFSGSGKISLVVFDGAAGQQISLKIDRTGLSGNVCDTVSILRPDGTYLVNPAYVCDPSGFTERQTLPAGGTYLVVLDPYENETGTAALTLYDGPPDVSAAIVPGGPPVTMTTAVPGQNAIATFSGVAGQHVALDVSFGSGFYGCSHLSIRSPDGTPLFPETLKCGPPSFTDVLALPATGTYVITINPQGPGVGSMTLTLYDVPPDAAATAPVGGPAVTVTVTTPGQNAQVSFSGTAGQRISLNVSLGPGLAIWCNSLSIRNPDGTPLFADPAMCGSSYFTDALVLPAAGTYVIAVDPRELGVGSATLTLYGVSDATATIAAGGSPLTVTTTTPGQNAQVTFSGAAGQRVSLNVSLESGLAYRCSYLSIRNPNGTPLLDETYLCNLSNFTDVLVLPATGAYVITVNPQDLDVGSATLTLYDVPPDATGTIVAGGSPVTVTTTTPGQNAQVVFGDGTPAAGVSAAGGGLLGDGFESGDLGAWIGNASGRRVALDVSFGYNSDSPCNSILIRNLTGTPLLHEKLVCDSSYFSDALTLAVPGPYAITVNPGGMNVGNATLTLYAVPDDATGTITVGGPPAVVTTTVPGQNAAISFNGVAGQSVTIRTTGSTLGRVTITLRIPDGSAWVWTYPDSTDFDLALQTLPATGAYTIFIDPDGKQTGSIHVAATSP